MNDKVKKFVDVFLSATAAKDLGELDKLLAEEVELYTPRFFKPITDREHFKAVLTGFLTLVQDLNYSEQRHWVNGNDLVFEFRGRVGKFELHGVDIFTLNDEGKIKTLSVMIRPPSALQELGAVEDQFIHDLLSPASV